MKVFVRGVEVDALYGATHPVVEALRLVVAGAFAIAELHRVVDGLVLSEELPEPCVRRVLVTDDRRLGRGEPGRHRNHRAGGFRDGAHDDPYPHADDLD